MKKHIIISLFLGLLLSFSAVYAQAPVWQYKQALDSVLSLQGVNVETPGFAVCIVQNGQVVYEKQSGAAHIGKKTPITEKTVFNIGSISKQFTAMCILLLEEAGKIKCTDEIHQYIPELPDYGYPITIRHLMGHTSGIRDYLELLQLQKTVKNKWLVNSGMLAFQQKSRTLNFPPGEDYNYSNTGYMMLCTIIERVSGQSLADFSQAHIFEPLGMQNTYFQRDGAKGVASGTASYAPRSGTKKFKKESGFIDALGATGVHTTLRDMVLWDQNFYHNVLGSGKPDLIARMEQPDTLNSGLSTYYGGGLFLRHGRGFPEVEHTGGWGSFCAQYRRFPQQKISILTASNSEYPTAFKVNDIVCSVLFQQQVPVVLPVRTVLPAGFAPEACTGIYLSDNNWVRKVILADSCLFIVMGTSANASRRRLIYQDTTGDLVRFRDSLNNPIDFYKPNGPVSGFRWTGGHYFPGEYNYKKIPGTMTGDFKRFSGVYRAPDFGRTIRIKYHKRSNSLVLCPFIFVKYRLIPVSDAIFEVSGQAYIIRFSENQCIIGDMWNRGIMLKRKS